MFAKRIISHILSILFVASFILAQAVPVYANHAGLTSQTLMDDDGNLIAGPIVQVPAARNSGGSYKAELYSIPHYLKASPADEWVHARGWPEGTSLDLTIRNAANTLSYSESTVVAQAPWNPNGPDDQVAIFELTGDWDVQVGDIVTVTDSIKEETLTVVDTTQLHWLSGNYETENVTAQQDATHAYNLANPEIELLFIVGWPGENIDYTADIFGPHGIRGSNAFKGEWLDLAPLITSSGYDTSQFAPQLMELYYNDDEGQYGLPFVVFPNMLYYQKGMFDAAGLNYPPANYGDNYVLDGEPLEWSIATMNEVAKRLTLDNTGKNATQPGFDPNNIIQYGYVPQWQSSTGIASLWGADTMLGGTPGAYTASIPDQWALAWKAYYNGIWGQEPFIPNGSAISNPEFGEGNSFNSGKFAMATVQAWYLCCIGNAGTNWELGTIPSYAGTVNGVFHADNFRIFKNTLHEQEAFDALVFLTDNATLIEAFDQMPARTGAQADFLARKETQYPFVDNWHLLQDGLNYIDDPNHESWMPNLAIALDRLNQFQDRMANNPGMNMDDEIEALRWGLEHIFNTGVNPGWPEFAVRVNDDRVEGWGWPNNATVTIVIERNGNLEITRTAEVGPASWNPDEIRFDYNFGGEFDIQAGDIVTVTHGTTTKSTVVSVHSITEIDVDTDIVYGVSDPDVRVYVWACDNNNCDYNRHADTNPITGEWQVDFSQPGIEPHEQNTLNIGPGTWVDSEQRDNDNDKTMFGINVPNPNFSARMAENEVHGYEWTLGTEVTLTIDDPNTPQSIDYTKTLTVGLADWNPNETFVQFRLWEDEFTLVGGMAVTMSDGTTQKTHLVTSLTVTGISAANDTVSGTALPDSQVDVGHIYCDESGCYGFRRASADQDGNWQVDFSQPGAEPDEQDIVDIVPGMGNEARQCDEDSDCTQYGWNVPNPRIEAWFGDNSILAIDWPMGEELTLEIDDPNTVLSPDYMTTETVTQASHWDPNVSLLTFNFDSEFDLKPGMAVKASGIHAQKEVIVDNLIVGEANAQNNTVSGTTAPDRKMWILVLDQDECCRHFVSDNSGDWIVNLSVSGDNGEPPIDLVPGSAGYVYSTDNDGDESVARWNVPIPTGNATGHVYQTDGITPLENMAVSLVRADNGQEEGQACTGADGAFTFNDVLHGTDYKVVAVPSRRCAGQPEGYTREYWQNTYDWEAATLITLSESQPNYVDIVFKLEQGQTATQTIGTGGGTVVTPEETVSLVIPSGAVSENTTFTVTDGGAGYQVATDQGDIGVVLSTTIGPEGTTFATPATLSFSWPDTNNDGVVDGTTIPEGALYLSKDGIVLAGPCTTDLACNLDTNRITVQVSSLSFFVVGPVNQSPTEINLSNASVMEGLPAGTAVGTFTTTDPDAGDVFTYTLVAGSGDSNNAAFALDGANLKTAAVFDYSVKNSYSIRIRTTDAGGLSYEKSFVIMVTDVAPPNLAPTNISLSNTIVAEGLPAGALVGTLSTTDPDLGDAFIHTLVAGTGDSDNAAFAITGNALKAAQSFNYAFKNSYSVRVRTTDNGGLSFEKAFTITISNQPAVFSDVPDSYWAVSFIERLYNSGITGGCATTPTLLYCPDSTVTRAQMAVFLLKSMHGKSYKPPLVGDSTGFGDVATSHWAASWIKQLAAEGITSGCGGGNYCPEAPVTRAQMAIFLLKAKNGSSYTPPVLGDGSGFGDVPNEYWAARWIKQLAAEGITGGCGAGNYCPENPVTRAQMAVFIVKTFGLP